MAGELLLNGGRRLPAFAGRPALWAWSLAAGLAAWCALVGLSPVVSETLRYNVPIVARNFGSGLFLMAGVMRVVHWRLTNERTSAHSALALLILGAAIPIVTVISPLMHQTAAVAQAAPGVRAVFLVPVFAILLPRARWPRPDRPIVTRFVLVASAVALAVMLAEVLIGRSAGSIDLQPVWLIVEGSAATCWLVLAARSWRDGQSDGRPTTRWMVAGLALLAGSELARAWTVAGAAVAVGIAPGVQLAAAVVALYVCAADLREAYRRHGADTDDLSRTLVDLQLRLADVEQAQRERLHDARSAVVGVMGATELLTQRAPTAADPELLRRLVTEELQRLQTVLDCDTVEPIEEFDLADALGPVVVIHRLDGRTILTDLQSLPVIGRPRATATVLDNLLRNVRVHAPGARVKIQANRSDRTATVVVEDDGPGIPQAEREQVLGAGVRGSLPGGPGSGLGLYSAAHSMREQGGSLQVGGSAGGGTRVTITLPAAPARLGNQALAS